MNQYCETRSIDSSSFFLTMTCVVCKTFQIIAKNVVLTIFLTVLTWMCVYGHKHMMVTHIFLDVAIEQ
jgi:presenilin-like A22 family membrane protease